MTNPKKTCKPLADDQVDAIAAVVLITVFVASVVYYLASIPS